MTVEVRAHRPALDPESWPNDALSSTKTGRAICLFASDPDRTHEGLESWAARSQPRCTLVTLEWRRTPALASELDETGAALSRAAMTLFPALYSSAGQRSASERWDDRRWDEAAIDAAVDAALGEIPEVSALAASEIIRACSRSQLPELSELPPAERVRQLALALDPEQLLIELLVLDTQPPPAGRLLALAKGAQWLARNSRARVLLIISEAFADSDELGALTYGVNRLAGLGSFKRSIGRLVGKHSQPIAADSQPSLREAAALAALPRAEPANDDGSLAPEVRVGAVLGRPHPASDAEKDLYCRIVADPELAPLFCFNQLVSTARGQPPRVDVLWSEGRLAIEIDGRDHARPGKFCQDRMRDYHLLISGYRVLRIAEAHVLADPELVVEWIRSTVQYLKKENHA